MNRLSTPYEKKLNTFKQLAQKKLPETITSGTHFKNHVAIVKDTSHIGVKGVKKSNKEKDKNEKKDETKGGGSIEVDFIPYNENIVHEFYDDPNELCERLRLLIASRVAGNSNHMQEINSIIAELREADVIF